MEKNASESLSASAIVAPLVTREQAKRDWQEYRALCDEILDDSDYTFYIYARDRDGKECKPIGRATSKAAEEDAEKLRQAKYRDVEIRLRKKRSAWDKLARFYNLSVPLDSAISLCDAKVYDVGDYIVEARSGKGFSLILYQEKATLTVVKASATVAVQAANGRVEIGEAVCSASERKGFAHADHDIPTTAFTRAKNRAISRAIGTGEVSAEEIDVEATAPAAPVQDTPVPVIPDKTVQVSNVQASAVPAAVIPPPPAVGDVFSPDPAAPLPERIRKAEEYLYGKSATDSRRENQLIKYAIFVSPDLHEDIESARGRLSAEKWNKAMLRLSPEARKQRMHMVEEALAFSGREGFKQWAMSNIERVFGK